MPSSSDNACRTTLGTNIRLSGSAGTGAAQNYVIDNSDKTNPNGGAVALGHPVGATGAILTVKTMYELERTGGRYGLVSLCIGGGQGIASIFERIS